MPADARSKLVAELAAEFVEERVRQRPTEAFHIDDLKIALVMMLREADTAVALKPGDDPWLSAWLDQHPFLLRAKAGSNVAWKPGLNKAAG